MEWKYNIGDAVQYRDGNDYEFGTVTDRRIENGYQVYIVDDRHAVCQSLLYPFNSW